MSQYCDNCADLLDGDNFYPVTSLLFPIDSANEGESAVLCPTCHVDYTKKVVGAVRSEVRLAFLDQRGCRWPDVDTVRALHKADILLAGLINAEPNESFTWRPEGAEDEGLWGEGPDDEEE